jgi:hypothetical protein
VGFTFRPPYFQGKELENNSDSGEEAECTWNRRRQSTGNILRLYRINAGHSAPKPNIAKIKLSNSN